LNCGGSNIVVLKKVARNVNPIQKGKRGLHVGDLIHIKGIKIDGDAVKIGIEAPTVMTTNSAPPLLKAKNELSARLKLFAGQLAH
jgi:hypothetical protein